MFAGGNLHWSTTLILGFAVVAANSLAIGISEYLSSVAHRNFLLAQRRREMWEFKHYRDGEVQQLVSRFESRGMARKDAELVASKMAQYENFFVNVMVSEQSGHAMPVSGNEADNASIVLDALVMFLSYGVMGCVPILVYLLGFLPSFSTGTESDSHTLYAIVLGVSLLVLFLLGVVKSSYSCAHWAYSGGEALLVGVLTAAVAYGMGFFALSLLSRR